MSDTQRKQILNYLRYNEWMTPMDAISLYGITKLRTRVGELKKAGFDIRSEWTRSTNRDGKTVRFKRYTLYRD